MIKKLLITRLLRKLFGKPEPIIMKPCPDCEGRGYYCGSMLPCLTCNPIKLRLPHEKKEEAPDET